MTSEKKRKTDSTLCQNTHIAHFNLSASFFRRLRFPNYCSAIDLCLFLFLTMILLIAVGCRAPLSYKNEADKEVYQIINQKWKPEFGQKANYRINDVTPSPNDIKNMQPTAYENPSTYDAVEESLLNGGKISLSKAVAIATSQNRDYQKQKEVLYLIALDLTLVRHNFVKQWFGTIDTFYNKLGEVEEVSVRPNVGFNQLLADGTQISMSIGLDWLKFLTTDGRTTLASVLTGNITKPLLRGAGQQIVQEQLTQAERDTLYQIRQFNFFRQNFVVTVISGYYRVLQRKNAVANAESNYKRRIALRERSEMEATVGRTPRFQVDQARQSELDAHDSYITSQQLYQQELDSFKILLALPTDAVIELDSNELNALEAAGVSEPNYTPENAIETALSQRLDLANSAGKVDDAKRKVYVAENGLGAELNIIGTADVVSGKGTNFTRLMLNQGVYRFGFEADLPFDRLKERNAYRESLILVMQSQRDYENAIDDVKFDVRQSYRQLQDSAERYKTQQLSLELAQKRVEVMPLLWENQQATTRDFLDAQDALILAQNQVMASLIDHVVAKLVFFRDIGVLQVRPDGMYEY